MASPNTLRQLRRFIVCQHRAAAHVTGDGVHHNAVSAKGSLLAPIPAAGPGFRYYLTNTRWVFAEAGFYGMYLWIMETSFRRDTLGITLSKHFSVHAGYQLGSRLTVNNKSNDRIGLRPHPKGRNRRR